MKTMIASFGFLFALLCVGLMGYAVQRGATCTVAAVDEIVSKRSVRRLRAMGEASLWVAGGLCIAQAFGVLPASPAGWAVSGWTVLGGMLLGLGAWLAGACVFGAIARLGSGQWAYVLTPLGYLVGCASLGSVFPLAMHQKLAEASPLLQSPRVSAALALLFAGFAAWRIAGLFRGSREGFAAKVWAPHEATIVIGITFVLTFLLAGGAWAYTDVLAEVARGMAMDAIARPLLFAALLGGAVLGGWTAGRLRSEWPSALQCGKCFAGGALMAWGTLLIPGANDGLILVGMPLLRPYAWLAFATMCATIAVALWLKRSVRVAVERVSA